MDERKHTNEDEMNLRMLWRWFGGEVAQPQDEHTEFAVGGAYDPVHNERVLAELKQVLYAPRTSVNSRPSLEM